MDLGKFNIPNILNTPNIPNIPTTLNVDLAYADTKKKLDKMAEEAYNSKQRMQNAIEQTASNTAETNVQLEKIIKHQNEYMLYSFR